MTFRCGGGRKLCSSEENPRGLVPAVKEKNAKKDLKHFQEKRSQKTEFSINKQRVLKEGERKTFFMKKVLVYEK